MNPRNAAVIKQNARPITGTCYSTRAGTPLTGALGAVGDGLIYEIVDPPSKGSVSLMLHIGTNFFDTSPADIERILSNIGRWEAENYPVYTFIARIIQSVDGTSDVDTFNNNVAAMVAARGNQRLYIVDRQIGAGLDYRIGFDMSDNLHPNQSGLR